MKDKILLIGGGFIGSNFLNYFSDNLNDSQYEIVVLSRSIQPIQSKCNYIRYVEGSYLDVELLNKLFEKERFTKVFHFASNIVPASSNQNKIGDLEDNLIASIRLMEVMKTYNCNFIVYLSSGGAVYGEFEHEKLSEEHPCLPISSYGIIKLTIEQYIKLYHKQSGLKYLILRLSNPYGPFHKSNEQGVVNIAIRKALKSELFKVWGNGTQSKDYIYVEDIIEIIFSLLNSGIQNETINVGSGETISLNFILTKIKELIPGFKVEYENSKPTDIMKFCLDTRILNQFVTVELTPFEKGLSKTVEWEKANLNEFK